MNLKCDISIPKANVTLAHSEPALALGSCFANEIGRKLTEHLFDCCENPLGTIFNPLAISELIYRSLNNIDFTESEFFLQNELWHHDLVHSSFASADLEESIDRSNTALQELRSYLLRSKLLFLTLGTAWVYRHKSNKKTIAHNHRRPLSTLDRSLAEPNEIFDALCDTIECLNKNAPQLALCITVSPVKHLRDGLLENTLSKSSLRLSAHKLIEKYPQINYFPAYEILTDELRDYRFYASDLAHPNDQAIDYIWQRFSETFFNQTTQNHTRRIEEIKKSLAHRPNHPETKAYKNFKTELEKRIRDLEMQGIPTKTLEHKWKSLP